MLPKFLKPFHISKSNLIRIGPKTDGGYIVDKRIFNRTDTLITCGLNDDWEFEKALLLKKAPNKMGKSALLILEMMYRNAFVTIPEMSNRIGITERAVEKSIQKLKVQGLIINLLPTPKK